MFEPPWKLLSAPLKPVKLAVTPAIITPISRNQINIAEFELAEMFWPFTNCG